MLLEARGLGYLGPGPVEANIEHALAYRAACPEAPLRALDLGSGGGLPGLVLALTSESAWCDTRWSLLDASAKRCAFLRSAVEQLALVSRVVVIEGRAEELGRVPPHRGAYDVVVARSFGRPPVTAECGAPFLSIGGHLLVSEPPGRNVTERWPTRGLAELGLEMWTEAPNGVTGKTANPDFSVVRLIQAAPCPERFPRRTGQPAKRPLW